ncbi:hypothetical protein EGC86_20775 [Shewanella frigidimarina]|uniref:hypothetical protein n=1 Tax=Shewanella frigidimarina TaxID=56812 RepID=UPI000F4FC550|nr:hypothetical protein [Shewanella frigidimarina]RPA57239.1 hypothetical protein EGC86_20775 [Shewanella frigidimarina]
MSRASTSTNAPYAGATSSSSPALPHGYVPAPSPPPTSSGESGFSVKEIMIYGGGLVLTAVVTYFSTLMSVNSDISNNRENISLLKSDVAYLQRDLDGAEKDISKNETASSKVGIIEVTVNGIQKQLDAHIGSVNENKNTTK